jgi:hypothetical protein
VLYTGDVAGRCPTRKGDKMSQDKSVAEVFESNNELIDDFFGYLDSLFK